MQLLLDGERTSFFRYKVFDILPVCQAISLIFFVDPSLSLIISNYFAKTLGPFLETDVLYDRLNERNEPYCYSFFFSRCSICVAISSKDRFFVNLKLAGSNSDFLSLSRFFRFFINGFDGLLNKQDGKPYELLLTGSTDFIFISTGVSDYYMKTKGRF